GPPANPPFSLPPLSCFLLPPLPTFLPSITFSLMLYLLPSLLLLPPLLVYLVSRILAFILALPHFFLPPNLSAFPATFHTYHLTTVATAYIPNLNSIFRITCDTYTMFM
ncbi:unnamed protein product, partial [Tuber aestivum]